MFFYYGVELMADHHCKRKGQWIQTPGGKLSVLLPARPRFLKGSRVCTCIVAGATHTQEDALSDVQSNAEAP